MEPNRSAVESNPGGDGGMVAAVESTKNLIRSCFLPRAMKRELRTLEEEKLFYETIKWWESPTSLIFQLSKNITL